MSPQEMKAIRVVIATIWMVTGILSLGIYPEAESMKLLAAVGLGGEIAVVALYGSALLDLMMGVLTLARPSIWLWRTQAALILIYSAIITVCLPQFWLHPFGPILKNLPILLLLWLLARHQRSAT